MVNMVNMVNMVMMLHTITRLKHESAFLPVLRDGVGAKMELCLTSFTAASNIARKFN